MWFLLIALSPPLVAAAVPASFHNRPGASPADVRVELARCRTIATGPDGSAVTGRAMTPASGPDALPRATEPVRATSHDCMARRGWRRYVLSVRERAALARMRPVDRERALARLVGAARPAMGRLVRDGVGLLRVPAIR